MLVRTDHTEGMLLSGTSSDGGGDLPCVAVQLIVLVVEQHVPPSVLDAPLLYLNWERKLEKERRAEYGTDFSGWVRTPYRGGAL